MYKRSDKVAEAIHEIVSSLLIRGMKDPRIGFVTVTGVKVTDDLHLATVFYSVVGSDQERKDTADALEHARGFFRREISRELRMKYVPDIAFKFDSSLEYGRKIDALLNQIGPLETDDAQ